MQCVTAPFFDIVSFKAIPSLTMPRTYWLPLRETLDQGNWLNFSEVFIIRGQTIRIVAKGLFTGGALRIA
jgi:hypothetical protein